MVVDAVVYGSRQSSSSANGTITSPEIATLEAEQGKGGCIAVVPTAGRGGGPAPPAATATNRSLGRAPDGFDADNLCTDFIMQPATTLPAASPVGATNIKVASVADFAAGQTLMIDSGVNLETAVIAAVGTAGATTVAAATADGATVIQVAGAAGFVAGQAITIETDAKAETAVVASTAGGGRGGAPITITVTARLAMSHAAGVQVAGTGITLAAPLARAHAAGAQVAGGVPTPGAANQYYRRRP